MSGLTPLQRDLAEHMSWLSEQAYSAGWMKGLEFDLWSAVTSSPFRYGRLWLTDEHVQALRQLSHACGGWIVFDDHQEESFVPLAAWVQMAACRQISGPGA